VNRKQRDRRHARRQAHRPAVSQWSDGKPTVKSAHVVPVAYQRMFADDDGRVAVHVPGHPNCHPLRAEEAGTRSKFYRRRRPTGSDIDDVEATLSNVEAAAGPALAEVVGGADLTVERKHVLAQLLGLQMRRPPPSSQNTTNSSMRCPRPRSGHGTKAVAAIGSGMVTAWTFPSLDWLTQLLVLC